MTPAPLVLVVMGVSGAGKTYVGRKLADALGWRFVEGDDHHPAANRDKMARGEALDDEDRGPWLLELRAIIEEQLAAGEGAVLACSALKKSYRAVLRVDPARVRFVFLQAILRSSKSGCARARGTSCRRACCPRSSRLSSRRPTLSCSTRSTPQSAASSECVSTSISRRSLA